MNLLSLQQVYRLMISLETVRHVAKLARLQLSEAEEHLYTEQLGNIIEYFDELAAIDTTDVEPMSHALPVSNVMRDDVVEKNFSHEELLKNAPDIEGEFFRVPKI
jgi:aspartyl-tRNA(Asn)/glutamyl-tRNA(Gln) amidotransferase subunit C